MHLACGHASACLHLIFQVYCCDDHAWGLQSAGGPANVKLVELKSSSGGGWMPMNNRALPSAGDVTDVVTLLGAPVNMMTDSDTTCRVLQLYMPIQLNAECCGSTGTVYGATWEIPQSPFPPPLDVRITNGNGDAVGQHTMMMGGCMQPPAAGCSQLTVVMPTQSARCASGILSVQYGCRWLRAKPSRAAERLGNCQPPCSSPLQACNTLPVIIVTILQAALEHVI